MRNTYVTDGDITSIHVKCKGEWITTNISTDMLPTVSSHDRTWLAQTDSGGRVYILYRDNHNKKWVYLHKVIVNCPEGKMVDHLNRDTLDNTTSNLKIIGSNMENLYNRKDNTSGVPGVTKHKDGKWLARTYIGGKRTSLGLFTCKYEAGRKLNTFRLSNNLPVVRIPIKLDSKQEESV